MLAALSGGTSRIRGALVSHDAQSTAGVLRALGVGVSELNPEGIAVTGLGRLLPAAGPLHCGNSGTTARLMLGILAAQHFASTLTGDASLSSRPMRRVTTPLEAMGAHIEAASDGLPLTITGADLQPLDWHLAVASAQTKSALLLAGAVSGVTVTLHEKAATRDHTERMLAHLGFTIRQLGNTLSLEPTGRFAPFSITIPGDPSSSIFLLAAAVLAERGAIRIEDVGLNPSRTGFVAVLRRMGVEVSVEQVGAEGGEPRGVLSARASALQPVTVAAVEVPGIVDEIPMLACLAARASGESRFHGLAELRVKESDRLGLLADNLRRIGVEAFVDGDDLIVKGTAARLSGPVITHGDHRIAMAFAVLRTQPGANIEIDYMNCAAVSFPGFEFTLARLFQAGT